MPISDIVEMEVVVFFDRLTAPVILNISQQELHVGLSAGDENLSEINVCQCDAGVRKACTAQVFTVCAFRKSRSGVSSCPVSQASSAA